MNKRAFSGFDSAAMPKLIPELSPSELDPALLEKLVLVSQGCLVLVGLLVLFNLAGAFVPGAGRMFTNRWPMMTADSVLAVLLALCSLKLAEARQSKWMQRLSAVCAALVLAIAAAVLAEYRFHFSIAASLPALSRHTSPPSFISAMPIQSAFAFALLGCTLLLIRARKGIASRVSDLAASCMALAVMTVVTGFILGTLPLFGLTVHVRNSPPTLLCLSLLALAVLIRRAESGVFSIFLGQSMGSRIARVLGPVVLILPFLREAARALFINTHRMPPHYTTAILASFTAMVALGLVLYLAWRIKGMETEIHDLSLRDALTGLYNLRGFRLLADQALRVAHRSNLPFSVLFIDLDDLKQTNDVLGHQTGSRFLTEMGEILLATFRETDILGRIGGDEFAVAGHFDRASSSQAARRLKEVAAQHNAEARREYALSFSVGHVTTEEAGRETLDEMLARADRAMYQEKRRKKIAAVG